MKSVQAIAIYSFYVSHISVKMLHFLLFLFQIILIIAFNLRSLQNSAESY